MTVPFPVRVCMIPVALPPIPDSIGHDPSDLLRTFHDTAVGVMMEGKETVEMPMRRTLLSTLAIMQSLLFGRAFGATAIEDDYDRRVAEYLQIAAHGDSLGGAGTWAQIARLELEDGSFEPGPVEDDIEFIGQRFDTSDFRAAALVRILVGYGDSPDLPADLRTELERALLDFKYWVDEPGEDSMVYWSENHQILFASADYLMGSAYPDEIFTNDGTTGREHADRAKARLERWMDHRFRAGFSEWLSNPYYKFDLAPVHNLADLAPDEDVRVRAQMILDLLYFDIAAHSFDGLFATTHGRTYPGKVTGTGNNTLATVMTLLSGLREYTSRDDMAAIALAISHNYRPPRAIREVFHHRPEELVHRQRVGFELGEAADYGLDFTSVESAVPWWGMGAYAHWRTVNLTFDAADAWSLWTNSFFAGFAALRPFHALGILDEMSFALREATCGSTLDATDIYLYRTPDSQLVCTQDRRAGQLGYQSHPWEAVLGDDANVFTSHPIGTTGDTPSYWTGGWEPKAVQHENVLVAIYDRRPASRIVPGLVPRRTHAYFPRDDFDETRQVDRWTFGRKASGYVALFSRRAAEWATDGEWEGRDLVAMGDGNTWICELGREEDWGSFDTFVNAIASAEVNFAGPRLVYDSPSQGRIKVGRHTALKVRGDRVDVHEYPRYDNPWCTAPQSPDEIHIEHDGSFVTLDFPGAVRVVSD